MQTICTSLQTDNHTNTSSLNFYRPDALPDAKPTVPTICIAPKTSSVHQLTVSVEELFSFAKSECISPVKLKISSSMQYFNLITSELNSVMLCCILLSTQDIWFSSKESFTCSSAFSTTISSNFVRHIDSITTSMFTCRPQTQTSLQ